MFQENYLLQEEIKKLKEKIRELQDTVDRQKERLIGIDFNYFSEFLEIERSPFIPPNPIVKLRKLDFLSFHQF